MRKYGIEKLARTGKIAGKRATGRWRVKFLQKNCRIEWKSAIERQCTESKTTGINWRPMSDDKGLQEEVMLTCSVL